MLSTQTHSCNPYPACFKFDHISLLCFCGFFFNISKAWFIFSIITCIIRIYMYGCIHRLHDNYKLDIYKDAHIINMTCCWYLHFKVQATYACFDFVQSELIFSVSFPNLKFKSFSLLSLRRILTLSFLLCV